MDWSGYVVPPQARGDTHRDRTPPTGRGPPLGSVSSQRRPCWCPGQSRPVHSPCSGTGGRRGGGRVLRFRRWAECVLVEVGWKGEPCPREGRSPGPCLWAALGRALRGVSADKQTLTGGTCSVHTESLRGRGTASGWNPGSDTSCSFRHPFPTPCLLSASCVKWAGHGHQTACQVTVGAPSGTERCHP